VPQTPSRRIAPALALALAVALWPAAAAPVDDYQRGLQAYQRGDIVGAMGALRPAAQAGLADAQQLLAFILDRADFVDEAIRLYQSAAAQDHPQAIAALGNLAASGRGLAKDENAALRHFSKAAALGHASSIEIVADAYLNGRLGLGGQRDTPQARAAVQRAAEQGHLASMQALAEAHARGGLGLAPDTAQAALWRQRAAQAQARRAAAASGSAR
jgi:TPR repeat protein